MALKETFFFDMNIFLHAKDKFLYYREVFLFVRQWH